MFLSRRSRVSPWARWGAIALIIFGTLLIRARADNASTVSIAAASNLVLALDHLVPAFNAAHPGITVRLSTGSSGSLVAQIRHGAPFDVFLSADLDYPRALIESDHAVEESLFIYAQGVLCLWPVPPGIATSSLASLFTTSPLPRIALANPDTAPFGRAAQAFLEKNYLWKDLARRAILGENVAQTYHFVHSGNANLGFVPLSLLGAEATARNYFIVPTAPHELAHGAVLLRRGDANPAASRFLAWLASPAAQSLLAQQGYQISSQVTLDAQP